MSVPSLGGGSEGDNSACSDCGGGNTGSGISSGPGSDFSAGDMKRFFVPNNQFNNSSFSPGYFSQFDSQLHIYPDTGSTTITFFDVVARTVYNFEDGLNGDTQDGEFHDTRNEHARKLELVNGSGTVVSDPASAVTAKVTHWNGTTETFGILDLDPDPTDVEWIGRLTQRTDLIGRDLDITYKTWTTAQISAAPDRQWQIDTVSDAAGQTLTP
jgi:hypothetical protein